MNTNIISVLDHVCQDFSLELERVLSSPVGTCYLVGHCLAEGLSNSGLTASERTGNLILRDKHGKSIVYGTAKHKGELIGYFHTWCVLEYYGERIIIDPSLRYMRDECKRTYRIKLHEKIPGCNISNEASGWYLNYIDDETLISESKSWLKKVDPLIVTRLIKQVERSAIDFHHLLSNQLAISA